jgi:transcriptional regulator with XRE-family HTH domain
MMQESLARKLRVLRAERGITLQEAEELTGVTRETLGALEHGQRGAYTNTLQKIAEGYGITVGELLEEPVPLGDEASSPAAPRHHVRTKHDSIEVSEDVKATLMGLFEALIHTLETSGFDKQATKVAGVRDEVRAA